MALAPAYYSTGTATVAANGTAVTGQGTSWLNAVQPGDVFGTHKGLPIRIASVAGNTSLKLAFPWPGGAQTAAAYEIMLVPDAGRVMETTRQLLEMLNGGELAAIAALESEADKLPYYTGAGTAGLTDVKAKGRELIASADIAGLLGTLGPVFGGPAPIPSSSSLDLLDGDFNALVKPGVFTLAGAFENGPNGAGAVYTGLIAVHRRVYNNFTYQALYINNVIMIRSQNTSGNWSAWERLMTDYGNNAWKGSQVLSDGSNYVQFGMIRGGSQANFEMLSTGEARLKTVTNNDLLLSVNSTNDRVRIGADGIFYFSATSFFIDPTNSAHDGQFGFQCSTAGRMIRQCNGYNPFRQRRVGSDGSIMEFYQSAANGTAAGVISVSGATTTYATSSDYRLKSDVEPLVTFALEADEFYELGPSLLRVMSLRPVRFRWTGQEDRGFQHGFIAHEVQAIAPHAVTGEKDEVKWHGREILPARTIEVEEVDEDGNPAIVEKTIPEQVNEDVREDGVTPGARFEPVEQRPVHQAVDYGQLTTDVAAALQEATLLILEQKQAIDALSARVAILEQAAHKPAGSSQ
ncbi:pyocin knob domain-containing S74 family peptidase [Sinorhizobium medicae]|uniref:pyocin knob domain-containing S74 family peptidase n=1 Tax=Sinorhizobium medicae TaxID=110321 RepID=UPI000401CF0B|nr:pyocin knob domain-containing S74 family peptidase [Sinorhizobium medicae]RVQ76106.1 tail fiber domain-containing protein [Sinorhizobium medicae]